MKNHSLNFILRNYYLQATSYEKAFLGIKHEIKKDILS